MNGVFAKDRIGLAVVLTFPHKPRRLVDGEGLPQPSLSLESDAVR